MPSTPTISELRKAGDISDDEIDAAVDAVVVCPGTGTYPIANGYFLDLAEAMKGHARTDQTIADPGQSDKFKRTMARTAILLARPDRR